MTIFYILIITVYGEFTFAAGVEWGVNVINRNFLSMLNERTSHIKFRYNKYIVDSISPLVISVDLDHGSRYGSKVKLKCSSSSFPVIFWQCSIRFGGEILCISHLAGSFVKGWTQVLWLYQKFILWHLSAKNIQNMQKLCLSPFAYYTRKLNFSNFVVIGPLM